MEALHGLDLSHPITDPWLRLDLLNQYLQHLVLSTPDRIDGYDSMKQMHDLIMVVQFWINGPRASTFLPVSLPQPRRRSRRQTAA